MSQGLAEAGCWIRMAANHAPITVKTHKLNHPHTEHSGEGLAEVDWRTFPRTMILAAAPSCVWHSLAGGRKKLPLEEELKRQDKGAIDRATAFAVVAAAEVHRYPVILVENVPEFQKWVLWEPWLDCLRALGYTIKVLVLNAKDFGHAQNRKRVFVLGTRGVDVDLTMPDIPPVYAADILKPDIGVPMTRRGYVSDQIDEITEEGVTHLVVYRQHAHARRADQNQLATITAGGNHHAIATIIDGVRYHRLLDNEERAAAQGFPKTYRFVGNDTEVRRQIGNATPVGIARFFGERIREAFTGEKREEAQQWRLAA